MTLKFYGYRLFNGRYKSAHRCLQASVKSVNRIYIKWRPKKGRKIGQKPKSLNTPVLSVLRKKMICKKKNYHWLLVWMRISSPQVTVFCITLAKPQCCVISPPRGQKIASPPVTSERFLKCCT